MYACAISGGNRTAAQVLNKSSLHYNYIYRLGNVTILADDANRATGQFGVDGCHLDGGRDQCGLGGHQGGWQGGGTGVAWNIGAGEL